MDSKSILNESLLRLVGRYDFIAAVLGAILATLATYGIVSDFFIDPRKAQLAYDAVGGNMKIWLLWLNPIFGASLAFVCVRTIRNYVFNVVPDATEELNKEQGDAFSYSLPEWPKPSKQFSIVLGEKHRDDGTYVRKPTWSRIPAMGLYGNMIAFGGIGSGKTASVAYPILRQILEYLPENESSKIGGLLLEVKGNFTKKFVDMAKQNGRGNDLILIRPGGQKWNPVHAPDLDAEVIASRLIAIHENFTGDSNKGDGAWIGQGVNKLLSHSIGLVRLSRGYLTLNDINEIIFGLTAAEEDDDSVARFLSVCDKGFNARSPNERDMETYAYHKRFFTGEWQQENRKNRSTIVGATTNITGLFSRPDIAETFCPKEDDIELYGFNDIIDLGRLVALDMPDSQYGMVSKALGILVKLEFQRAILSRVARAEKDRTVNTSRMVYFLADEYQNFVSSGGISGEGDDNFFALSRESKCFSLVMTQSPISLASKITDEKMRVILASIRNKIFLTIIDHKDAEMAADICGKDWLSVESVGINESIQNATWNTVDNSMGGNESTVSESVTYTNQLSHVIDPIKFSQLRVFEAFVFSFDGIRQLKPTQIYLKTDFVPDRFFDNFSPRSLPYNKLITEIGSNINEAMEA